MSNLIYDIEDVSFKIKVCLKASSFIYSFYVDIEKICRILILLIISVASNLSEPQFFSVFETYFKKIIIINLGKINTKYSSAKVVGQF